MDGLSTNMTEQMTRQVMQKIEQEIIDAIYDGFDGIDVIYINPLTDQKKHDPLEEDFEFRLKVEKWAHEPPEVNPGTPQFQHAFQRFDWREYDEDELHQIIEKSSAT